MTDIQGRVLDFLRAHLRDRGFPPTRREVANHMGYESANAAEHVLRALQRKGFISIEPGTPRGIKLL